MCLPRQENLHSQSLYTIMGAYQSVWEFVAVITLPRVEPSMHSIHKGRTSFMSEPRISCLLQSSLLRIPQNPSCIGLRNTIQCHVGISWNEASSDIFLFIVNNYLRQSSCRTALESQLISIKLKFWGFRLIWSNQTVRFTTNTTILMITSFI